MSEEKIKTTAIIFIGGKEFTINKLRAGKFYGAQKIIASMFRDASKIAPTQAGKKSPDMKDIDISNLVGMIETFPQQVAGFVACCAEIEEKDLLEKAYPEEISKAFGVCLDLNNVMENLKNSVAPIEKLGARKE